MKPKSQVCLRPCATNQTPDDWPGRGVGVRQWPPFSFHRQSHLSFSFSLGRVTSPSLFSRQSHLSFSFSLGRVTPPYLFRTPELGSPVVLGYFPPFGFVFHSAFLLLFSSSQVKSALVLPREKVEVLRIVADSRPKAAATERCASRSPCIVAERVRTVSAF